MWLTCRVEVQVRESREGYSYFYGVETIAHFGWFVFGTAMFVVCPLPGESTMRHLWDSVRSPGGRNPETGTEVSRGKPGGDQCKNTGSIDERTSSCPHCHIFSCLSIALPVLCPIITDNKHQAGQRGVCPVQACCGVSSYSFLFYSFIYFTIYRSHIMGNGFAWSYLAVHFISFHLGAAIVWN